MSSLGLMAISGPYGFYTTRKFKQIKEIETRLPDFLRDVAEAGRFGMTLAEAVKVASRGRYGGLTPEIRRMAAQIDWGVPAAEAMRLFSERVDTPLVKRMMSIIIKANDAGGNVADVLTMVAHDARETMLSQDERKIAMATYTVVIYVAFMVFIATIFILNTTFLPKMEEAGQPVAEGAEAAGHHQHARHHQDRCHPDGPADIRRLRGHTRLRRRHSGRSAAGRTDIRTA